MPAVQAALKELENLDKNDITEYKNYKKPQDSIRMVAEAVCVLLGEKP